MTTETDLPPLPERFSYTNSSTHWCYSRYTMTRDDRGDYVLAEDYDALRNASEALQAEIEALRAERDALLRRVLEAVEEASNALYEGHPIRVNTQKAIDAIRNHLGAKND